MRIMVNGWFAGQLTTGSGQYLAALQAWLPQEAAGRHDFILVLPAMRAHQLSVAGFGDWRVVEATTPLDRVGENLAKLWFEQMTFPWLCRRYQADVACVPYWGSSWWQPCPVVVTVHDIIPLLLPAYRGGILQRGYTLLVATTARRAAAILTDSEASRRDILTHLRIPPTRVRAVHLAVDARFRRIADQAELDRVRSRYGLPGNRFWLYLGGFDARKNVPRLLQAYAQLYREHRAGLPSLVIAGRLPRGDSALATDPRPLAAHLGLADAVHFTGWVDEADKPALYSLANAALFISEYEGFGLPVLEAQACGCPVIAGGRIA